MCCRNKSRHKKQDFCYGINFIIHKDFESLTFRYYQVLCHLIKTSYNVIVGIVCGADPDKQNEERALLNSSSEQSRAERNVTACVCLLILGIIHFPLRITNQRINPGLLQICNLYSTIPQCQVSRLNIHSKSQCVTFVKQMKIKKRLWNQVMSEEQKRRVMSSCANLKINSMSRNGM